MSGIEAREHASVRQSGLAAQAVIGPNIVIRTAESLTQAVGADLCARVFADAGLARYLGAPPDRMVSETEVAALYRALPAHLGEEQAWGVARGAGQLTGDYLLAHRIPQVAQRVLACLPRRIAASILLAAIARHAWTFVGSGRFSYGWTPGLELRIEGSPLCGDPRSAAPIRAFYSACFERVLSAMLGPSLRVEDMTGRAAGVEPCRFDVYW
jgi:divinyl protochlorophyllide a 8-vinyl-reductase